jgi:gluconokinase
VNAETTNSCAIVVMGVSGCGKSTVGRLLAANLNCPFIEGDELHDASSIAKMRSGQSLSDEDRWPWLDRVGHAMRASIAERGAAVAACSALRNIYRDKLAGVVKTPIAFIMLEASRDELLARMHNRPDHFMPTSLLDSQLSLLEPPRQPERALILNANTSPEALCETIRAWL